MTFTVVGGGGTTSLILPSAKAALESLTARRAPVDAELRDAAGRVLARKHAVAFEGGELLVWCPTAAWTEPVEILDLTDGADVDDAGHPATG